MKCNNEKLEQKIDKLDERLDQIQVILAKQHESIEHHIKRTDLLESEVKPIKILVYQIMGVAKFLALLATISALATSYLKWFAK
jgi:hypothetical protein